MTATNMDQEEEKSVALCYPHCDQRILHAPGECEYCDDHPSWQALRISWGIAFTGHAPAPQEHDWTKQLPCPADYNRPPGSMSDHRRWGGNKPTGALGKPDWPAETFASQVIYGDMGGRKNWSLVSRLVATVTRLLRQR